MTKKKDTLIDTLTNYEARGKKNTKQKRKPFTTKLCKNLLLFIRGFLVINLIVGIAASSKSLEPGMAFLTWIVHFIIFFKAVKAVNEYLIDIEEGLFP